VVRADRPIDRWRKPVAKRGPRCGIDRERSFSSRVVMGYWIKLAAEDLRPDCGYALTRAGPIVAHVPAGVRSFSLRECWPITAPLGVVVVVL